MGSRRAARPGLLIALLSFCGQSGWADLPAVALTAVTPPGGKAGSEVEVALTGSDLDEAKALHFTHAGITAVVKEKKFLVKIAPEVPAGIYDVRVSGKFGISNPRAFVVGDLPEAAEAKANDTAETAADVAAGSTFNGTISAANADYLKFSAKQGQRLFIECLAHQIDSRLTPVLAVLDANRREIAASRRGGFLDFTAPTDGDYFVEVHDLTYAGGPEFFYRVSLTRAPRLDFVFPPSGTRGTKQTFSLYGRNLPNSSPAGFTAEDGKPLEKIEVGIDLPNEPQFACDALTGPSAGAVDGFPYRLQTAGGASNPVFISFAGTTPLLEHEPNNAEAQKVTPPCEIAGQFYPANDRDIFIFDAKKGETYTIEVVSERLGAGTNPFILIQRDKADVQEVYRSPNDAGGKRFSTVTNDPAARLEIKEDGSYRVQVRDLFGTTRSNPRNVYRLLIRKETPDFGLVALSEPQPVNSETRKAPPRALVFRPGETCPIRVVALRRDNFAGEIELAAEGLPEGVTCGASMIPAAKNEGMLLLSAAEGAAPWTGSIRITGTAKSGGAEIVRQARAGAVIWPVNDYNAEPVPARLTRDFLACVTAESPAPLSIEPAEEKVWEVAAGGKLEIPLKITRRGEFTEPLKLKVYGAPEIEKAKETDVDGKAATATASIDLTATKIPAGTHVIHFRADTKGKFNGKETPYTVCSKPIRIVVK